MDLNILSVLDVNWEKAVEVKDKKMQHFRYWKAS